MKPGSTYGALTFISDFLFTDIMNHVEFLKFIITLGKQDDALLVCLLERYAAVADTETLHNPFYSHPEEIGVEHVNLPKNPLRIAISYAELLELKGHSFNIFEFACHWHPTVPRSSALHTSSSDKYVWSKSGAPQPSVQLCSHTYWCSNVEIASASSRTCR